MDVRHFKWLQATSAQAVSDMQKMLWEAQLEAWPDSIQVPLDTVIQTWTEPTQAWKDSTLKTMEHRYYGSPGHTALHYERALSDERARLFRWVMFALADGVVVFYEIPSLPGYYGIPTRGCRFGIHGSEYRSGYN